MSQTSLCDVEKHLKLSLLLQFTVDALFRLTQMLSQFHFSWKTSFII